MMSRAELLRFNRTRQKRKRRIRRNCAVMLTGLLVVIGAFTLLGKPVLSESLSSVFASSNAWEEDVSPAGRMVSGTGSVNQLHPNIPIPLLVNAANPLPTDETNPELVDLIGIVPVADSTIQAEQSLVAPLIALFTAAEQSGIPDFYVNSAFRTHNEQQALYRDSEDTSYVQKPGQSEHQTGLAVDLAVADLNNEAEEGNDTWQWLAQHAWEYGFILRYPADKVDITDISYEPWHFRYVGREVAQYCFEHGMCLEEYVTQANGL
jgi:LAS superfamily LD-carboxypeptidase LdcB